MARFLAITSRGLIEPLAAELEKLQIKNVKKIGDDGVAFDSSWADAYKVHLWSRLTSRVLLPVADFEAYNQDDLYQGIYKRHDFTKYIDTNQTFKIEAHVREHKNLRDQRFVAMKVKDAIADQFREKYDERPTVALDGTSDLIVVVRIVGPKVSVAIDLTGESLSHRGYRKLAGEAPLRETLAAALVQLTEWKAPTPMVDPFCGSGTILIEAAMMAAGLRPSIKPRHYAFENLDNFQPDAYKALQTEPVARVAAPAKPFLFGFDKDGSVLEKARSNARAAGVENWIHFEKMDALKLEAPVTGPGVILTNPPYGERLEDTESAKALMSDFSTTLKNQFKGWDAWILSGNADAIAGLRLKAKRKIQLYNGSIDCRLLHYPMS